MTTKSLTSNSPPTLIGVDVLPMKQDGIALLQLIYEGREAGKAEGSGELTLSVDLEQIEKFVGVMGNAAAVLRDSPSR